MLTTLAKAGDSEAIGLVYFGIRSAVEQAAQRAYGEIPFIADEVADRGLHKVLVQGVYGESHGDGNFEGWARIVTTNLARDLRRQRQRRPMVSIDEETYSTVAEHRNASPSAEVQALGGHSIVASQITSAFDAAGVPPEFRQTFILHHVYELTYEQIADRLGVSLSTVNSRIHRAKKRMLAYYGTKRRNIFDDPTE